MLEKRSPPGGIVSFFKVQARQVFVYLKSLRFSYKCHCLHEFKIVL